MCNALLIMGLGVFVATSAQTQDAAALRYKFKPGQVLRYDGKQVMNIESTVSGTTQKDRFETTSVREWRVLELDEKGNARLTLTIVRVQVAATTGDGKRISFDTDKDGEKSPVASLVGKPLLEVRLSPSGQVLEIRQSEAAGAGQFAAHVRSLLVPLPPLEVGVGTGWQQDLELPLPPPVGAGEQVRIRQTYRLEKVADSVATINLRSAVAEEIKDGATMARIAQFLPGGRIELDLTRGVVRSLRLTLDQTVTDFAGKDSTMHVTGSYREVLRDELAGTGVRRQ